MCFKQFEDLSEKQNNLHSLIKKGIVGRGGRGDIKFNLGGRWWWERAVAYSKTVLIYLRPK